MKVAFDFDGTLFGWVERGWSGAKPAGEANVALIELAKRIRANGHQIILWTCREGADLQEAVDACARHGLRFDAVNANLQETISGYLDSRKIVADLYVDDRGLNPKALDAMAWALCSRGSATPDPAP